MNLKKKIRKLHLWMGFGSGAIVIILGLTGCIYAFIDELIPLVYKDHLFVQETTASRKPLDELIPAVRSEWGDERPLTTMEVYSDPSRSIHFRSFRESGNTGIWYWDEKEFYESIFVDPNSGEIIRKENSQFEFFRVILYLHWSLLLHTEIGKPIVGTATLIFVFSLISGLILWWPKNKNAQKARYWFRWKPATGTKRKIFDLHNIPGFYALPIALILALTGLFWAFDWFGNGVRWVANAGKEEPVQLPVYSDTTQQLEPVAFSKILGQASLLHPDAISTLTYFPTSRHSPINMAIRKEKSHRTVILQFDQFSGEILRTVSYQDKSPAEQYAELNYDIHVGSIGGIWGKIVAFLASLLSASLPITGFLIWYNRNYKKKKTNPGSSPA